MKLMYASLAIAITTIQQEIAKRRLAGVNVEKNSRSQIVMHVPMAISVIPIVDHANVI